MSELQLTQDDNGKSFMVHQNDIITILLDENRTTGYLWTEDMANERILTHLDSQFSLPEKPKIGEGGIHSFIFKAERVGTGHIQLKKCREWKKDNSSIERFDVAISVID